MKKILLLFVCLAANLLPGRAQMMPDSTVQVVAYWKLGDKQYYRYESTQFKIKQQDTVVAKRSAGIISMEVISADEEKGYRLKVSTLESQESDPIAEALNEQIAKNFGAEDCYIDTDPYGTIQQFSIPEGLGECQEDLIKMVSDALKQKYPDENPDIFLPFLRQMITPENLVAMATNLYSPLFMFHGARLALSEKYEFEDNVPSIFTDGTMKMSGYFWVNEEATDEESVLLQLTKTADKEELKPFLFNNLNAIIQNMAKDMDQETLTSDLEKLYDTAKMSITDQIIEVVHLDTGWPIEYLFRRDVEMVISDEAGGQITQTTFTIIPQEEEQ